MAAAERHKRYVRLIVPGAVEAVEEVNPFARIYYVPAKYSPVFDKRYRIIMPWQYMMQNSLIRKILLTEMPDLVEVTDKYTLSLIGPMVRKKGFQQLGRPALVHFSCERMDDNIGSFLTEGKFGRWAARRIIGNYTMPSFDYHIANSTYTAQEFIDSLSRETNPQASLTFRNWCWRFFAAPRVDYRERIFVAPRGVDANLFTPERRSAVVKKEMRERAGIPDDAVLLLYAGRISPEKNIELLVELMKELAKDPSHDFRLLIAGAGPQSEWLTDEGEKSTPGRIIQLGHLEKQLLADYYANADVFVHPNPKEPFGIAPLEAMASGVPTVAPNGGGILSYATNENAWLVEPNCAAFAEAVRDVIENTVKRDAKVAAAITTARENTRERSTDNLFATYDRIYEDFKSREDLFTDIDAAKTFDFAKEILAPKNRGHGSE
ncbi:MAG: glycosyltransferase [Pyrinomonadaceae bacterium]